MRFTILFNAAIISLTTISFVYFPKIDRTGKWMVWCATQNGHEHDMVDYEVHVWDITTDKTKKIVRLTFHSGNDRWPDIFIE